MAPPRGQSRGCPKFLILLLGGLLFCSPVAGDSGTELDEIEKWIRLRDYDQAVSSLQALSRQGESEALYRLASLYRAGRGVERDLEKASALYHRAASAGHAEAQFALAMLIEKTSDSPTSRGEALRWYSRAAALGHARAKLTLERFDDIPELSQREVSRDDIFDAIRHNDEILVTSLIAGGANLDLSDRNGNSTVIAALRAGWPRLAAILLDNTRMHSQANALGTRPLHVAASRDYREVVEILLAREVDIDATDARGNTALMLAIANKNIDIAALLLNHGARHDLVNRKNRTAVELAYSGERPAARALFEQRGIRPAAAAEQAVAIDLPSFRQSVELHGARYAGWPLLNIAIELGEESIAEQLIDAGPDLGLADPDGNTALHVAARKGDRVSLQRLLAAGAAADAQNRRGETALHLAVEAGSLAAVTLLLQKRADPAIETALGATALETAVAADQADIARALLAGKGGYAGIHRLLLQAIQNGNEALAHELIRRDEDLGTPDESGRTALWHSADRGLAGTAEILVASGKIDLNQVDVNGYGALAQAIVNGHDGIVRLLIQRGASLTPRTVEGNTLLMLAVLARQPAIVSLLLGHGVDIDAQDKVGDTALMLAASSAQVDIIELLINAGANLQLRNGEELNAYQMAVNAGHRDAAQLIHDKSNVIFKLFN